MDEMRKQSTRVMMDVLGGKSRDDAFNDLERDLQREVVGGRAKLPKQADREAWGKIGVTFGADIDDLFCEATLPAGWTVKPTDHAMWNAIHDDKGRKRGMFFAKTVFYDRDAFLREPETRYKAVRDYDACGDDQDYRKIRYQVKDNGDGSIVWTGDLVVSEERFDSVAEAAQRKIAEAWLDEHHDGWRDFTKCWD